MIFKWKCSTYALTKQLAMTASSGLTETAHPLRVEDTPERSLLHCTCRKKQKSFSLLKLVLSASTTARDLQSFLDREKLWLTLDMLAFQIYQDGYFAFS